MRKFTISLIQEFKKYLIEEEKSAATLDKYIRDVTVFMQWINGQGCARVWFLNTNKK